MPRARRLLTAAAVLAALPVAGTLLPGEQRQLHVAAGEAPLCRSTESLGRTAVVTEFVWRADQKERAQREALVADALRRTLAQLPCFAAGAPAEGEPPDTRILVRVYEAGPVLSIGILPPHWLGGSEVELAVTAIDMHSNLAVRYDAHLRLARGGLFALRGTGDVERDVAEALALLLGGAPVR